MVITLRQPKQGETHDESKMLPQRHDGQNTYCFSETMSSLLHKNIPLSEIRKQSYISSRPALTGGRVAIVTNVEGGMRWTYRYRKACETDAYGQAVWS